MLKKREREREKTSPALSNTGIINEASVQSGTQGDERDGQQAHSSLMRALKQTGQLAWLSDGVGEAYFGDERGASVQAAVGTGGAVSPGTVSPPSWVGHTLRAPLTVFQGGDPPEHQELTSTSESSRGPGESFLGQRLCKISDSRTQYHPSTPQPLGFGQRYQPKECGRNPATSQLLGPWTRQQGHSEEGAGSMGPTSSQVPAWRGQMPVEPEPQGEHKRSLELYVM